MRQIKIFKCLEHQCTELEDQVNGWIRDSKVDVVDVRLQLAPQSPGVDKDTALGEGVQSDVMCLVVYEAG